MPTGIVEHSDSFVQDEQNSISIYELEPNEAQIEACQKGAIDPEIERQTDADPH